MQTLTREMAMAKIYQRMERDLAGVDIEKEVELINQKKSKLSSRTRALVLFQKEINEARKTQAVEVPATTESLPIKEAEIVNATQESIS